MKKLIPAICMTLIASVMFASSTFAWFSMNTSVKATNLQVAAKSDNYNLLINKTGDNGKGSNSEDLTLPQSGKYVVPCSYTTDAITDQSEPATTLVAANNWYTATSKSFNQSTAGGVENYKVVTAGDSKYMVAYTCYLTMATNSESFTGTIDLDFAISGADKTSGAIFACVIFGDFTAENFSDADKYFLDKDNNHKTTGNHTINSGSAVKVTVYMYIDGKHDFVTSENAAKDELTGTVEITFTLGTPQTQPVAES